QGTETRHHEIDEVKSFSGGQIKSVEPEVEVTEHLHHYSGGDIIERSDTKISPLLYGFWAVTLVVIVAAIIFYVLPGFFNPAMRGAEARAGSPAGGIGNYGSISTTMQENMVNVGALASPTFIDMRKLPLPDGQNLDQAVSAGTDVYQTYCIGCHGPNQDGNGPNSVSLDPKPRNLRDVPFMQAMSYQRIWTSAHKGVPGTAMPRWENTLSDTQFEDVIAYVFSLTAPKDPTTGKFISPSPADIAGAASPSAGPPGYAGNSMETGAEAPHGPATASGLSAIMPGSTKGTSAGPSHSLAPATGPGTQTRPKALLTGPITGPPSH
ncbi:MAG TPA: cytochrome c, partial [Capsulimonadaceae bacterium]|nr:cytochrome c [Capsulimonadaceae bacterium]